MWWQRAEKSIFRKKRKIFIFPFSGWLWVMMTSYDTSFESVSHKLQDESYDVMIESLFRYFRFGAGVTSGRKFNFGFEAWLVEWWRSLLKTYFLSKVSQNLPQRKKRPYIKKNKSHFLRGFNLWDLMFIRLPRHNILSIAVWKWNCHTRSK